MLHRHLEEPGLTLASIDDIIERGGLDDWLDLGLAVERDPAIRRKVARIVLARSGDQTTIGHDFWRRRLELRPGQTTGREGAST